MLLVVLPFLSCQTRVDDMLQYQEFIKKVSEEISALKDTYPQLKEFSMDKHVDIDNLRVDYSYHTHESERSGGWTSGVPNPDPDGIWFYFDLHDPDSTAQIHTQPVTGISLGVGDKSVCFLVLEGSATKPLGPKILSILERNGAKSLRPF